MEATSCGPTADRCVPPLRALRPEECGLLPAFDHLPCLADCFFRAAQGVLRDCGLLGQEAHGGESPEREAVRAGRAFLARRGFDLKGPGGPAIGLVDSAAAMRARLLEAGFSRSEVRRSKLLADQRLAGRLVGPITTPQGRTVSFWARHPDGRSPRYLYWRGDWKDEAAAAGLQSALGGEAAGRLVLVDDILDALMLQSRGMTEAAGLGDSGEEITVLRWQRLHRDGAAEVTLAPDRTADAGCRIGRAVRAFFAAQTAMRLFVLAPARLGAHESPGDLVRREGIEALRALLARARVHVATLDALALLAGPRPEAPRAPGYCPLHRCGETECFCFD